MILVKPSAEIMSISPDPLQMIERAGRTCYKSEDKITPESAAGFAGRLVKSGHHSVIEHASATVRFVCDRGVSHELVRHRLASFSQESTRYCDYSKGKFDGQLTFVIPPWVDLEPGIYRSFTYHPDNPQIRLWALKLLDLETTYKALINYGQKPEQARSVLPNSLKTEVVMTANLREWRHVFTLRASGPAHPQMREIMIPLLAEFQRRVPVIFDDLGEAR